MFILFDFSGSLKSMVNNLNPLSLNILDVEAKISPFGSVINTLLLFWALAINVHVGITAVTDLPEPVEPK